MTSAIVPARETQSGPAHPAPLLIWRVAAEVTLWGVITLVALRAMSHGRVLYGRSYLLWCADWLVLMGPSLILWHSVSPAWRKPLAIALGVAFLMWRAPRSLFVMAFTMAMYYLPAMSIIPRRVRAAIFAALLMLFCWGSAVDLPRNAILLAGWVAMVNRYIMKLIYWYYERSTIMRKSPPLVDYAFYFFGVPCAFDFVNCSFLYLQRRECSPVPPDLIYRGLRHMRLWWMAAMAWCMYHWLFPNVYGQIREIHRDRDALLHLSFGHAGVLMLIAFVTGYVVIALGKEMSVGALRLLGYDVHVAYDNPLASASPAEFWRHYNVYVYEFVRSLFFFPVATYLARRFPRRLNLCTFVAVLATFAGLGCLQALPSAFYCGRTPGAALDLEAASFGMTMSIGLLVAVSVLVEGWVRGRGIHWPRPMACLGRWAVGVPFTLLSLELIYVVFQKKLSGPASSPWDALHAVWNLLGIR